MAEHDGLGRQLFEKRRHRYAVLGRWQTIGAKRIDQNQDDPKVSVSPGLRGR